MALLPVQCNERGCSLACAADYLVSLCERIATVVTSLFFWITAQFSRVYRYFLSESMPAPISSSRLDPFVYENALIILNLSSQEVQNTDVIRSRHVGIIEILTERKRGLPTMWAEELGRLIDDTNIAYQTVIQRIPEKKYSDRHNPNIPKIEDID